MTITLGAKMGEGGCSEVYELPNNQVIKLAKENTLYDSARGEYLNNCIAWENGLPVPQPFDFIDVDGRPGIVTERIVGETITKRLINQIVNAAGVENVKLDDFRQTARLMYQLHNITLNDIELANQREVMKGCIDSANYLSNEEKEAVLLLTDSLPLKQCMCHGDPNPNNIIVQNDGKAVLIDWMNATLGNPEADLAEFIVMIRYAVLSSDFPEIMRMSFDQIKEDIINTFMDEYTRLSGLTYEEVVPWLIPIAARKLSADGISESEKNILIEQIRRAIGTSR
ncbi:uncharacterized protein (TIGR02172 family) [Paenibacillus cellulosilyticus]|uniref:Uncharacterized protein (TIGR02172 family) n=1 Tax=Paenibacillus cellulosilyticus TaxID=375489 RepID=A0A2V2YLW9_9BACL|nr:phosphotransferase [Paenibacillus cellulosilyticus]PWV94478.1 uncharacterized protein (TIGR02172 family) [Paenibacillus cellulosilyticus]QKS44991.1 phosphotransferase [Paenibacillus cellulosilyticus]